MYLGKTCPESGEEEVPEGTLPPCLRIKGYKVKGNWPVPCTPPGPQPCPST